MKVFMSIWEADDTEMEHGAGRYFDTLKEAIERFNELKEGLYACLIEFDDKPIFTYVKDNYKTDNL